MRCPPDELIAWKREFLREPAHTLPPLARFLTPFYQASGDLNELVPINYEDLKQRIQQSLPAHNASADLYMEMLDAEETLV
ncbi:Protein CBG07543 [Caenorhabditis briggsae]|uniref:Protein CBG07543 n=1 Tax=Caenorhabditis briggsae TaxID=6238 RepID=A8X4L5_CAEBR|nr:Protein CBG07543 [Caenorhabditis briggsae]CAP27575.1 Protein CBG07543 [Caenorhabditis briggsae]